MPINAICEIRTSEIEAYALAMLDTYKDGFFDNKTIVAHHVSIPKDVDNDTAIKEGYLRVYYKLNCQLMCECETCPDIVRELDIPLSELGVDVSLIEMNKSYRYEPRHGLKRGDAIRIVRIDDADPINAAFNAIVINYVPKVISYLVPATHGPVIRTITAMEAYNYKVSIYKYKNPDDYEDIDPDDVDNVCDVQRESKIVWKI